MKANQKNPPKRATEVVATVKTIIEREFSSLLQQHPRLVQLSLNEAEALAWETGIPHLVLPVLATERIQGLAAWNVRQESIRRREQVLAFAA